MNLKHNITVGFTTVSMILFMATCRLIGLPEPEWRQIEDIVFGWVERNHV